MKLILTSSGLTSSKLGKEFKSLLGDPFHVRVAILYTAQRPEYLSYSHTVGLELSRWGILIPNMKFVNIEKEKCKLNVKDFDVVYVCGGNTFFILDCLRKNKYVSFIDKFVKRGGVYIGVSAGSILASSSIELAGMGSEGDQNEIRLKNLEGLGLTKVSVYPHYKNRLRKEIESFKKTVKYPIEVLRDKEALIIKGNSIRKISRWKLG